ncbi:MAG: helix-turn-helix transcriptional regulator [Terriglobales bacterium]
MTNDFTRFLRRRRQVLEKTQADIAQACGLTVMSITLVEAGRRRLALERVPRLAEALQVDPSELCLLALRCRYPELTAALTAREVQ